MPEAGAEPPASTSELFGGIYARGAVAGAVSDTGWLQAMLDAEAALATAGALQVLVREAWQATAPAPEPPETKPAPEPPETEDEDPVPPPGGLFPARPD